jgi:hypothetical protein
MLGNSRVAAQLTSREGYGLMEIIKIAIFFVIQTVQFPEGQHTPRTAQIHSKSPLTFSKKTSIA